MFDRVPKEREILSWGYAVFWACLTFVTVPYVRDGVDWVEENWGTGFFTYAVAACAVAAAGSALYITRRRWSFSSFISLLGVAGVVIYLAFDLASGSSVEAVHYVQYGTLSLLLFRAFSHRVRDYSIYLAVTITGTLAGMVDETIQWLAPDRVFDLRDIWLNCKATALVQIGIAAGMQPKFVSGWPSLESWRRLCFLAALTLGYFGLCLQNTPERISWYSSHVPGLGFIDPNKNIMVEYGYLHGDASTVLFRSRMTREEMLKAASLYKDEGALIFKKHHARERNEDFADIYSRVDALYIYEARVHQIRRDLNVKLASRSEDQDKKIVFLSAAYWQNHILEENFAPLLLGSGFDWSARQEADVRQGANINKPYQSRFGIHLIVSYSSSQLAYIFFAVVTFLVLAGYVFKRMSKGASTA